MELMNMPSVDELKNRIKSLQTEKKQLNNELKSLKLKLDLKKLNPNPQKTPQKETEPQLKELVALK